MLITSLAWLAPVAWVSLTPPFHRGKHLVQRTRSQLNQDQAALTAYFSKYHQSPANFSVLRAFAYSERLPVQAFDPYGQRFEYIRLDDQNYVLRSFGRDGDQNTLLSQPDASVSRLARVPEKPLLYKYSNALQLDIYPTALLVGAESPNHQWFARLHSDPVNGQRYLLVRNVRKKDLLMISEHDAVEEFLWLPNGYQIVFTATGSARYRDGVYLWNLMDGSTTNLLDRADNSEQLSPAAHGQDLWLSLAGINVNGPTLYLYLAPRRSGAPLDPTEFFNKSRLIAFQIFENQAGAKLLKLPSLAALATIPPFTKPLQLEDHIDGYKPGDPHSGSSIQRKWLSLALQGDMEDVLVTWQTFAAKEAGTPLFPYCLWFLSSLYSESFSVLHHVNDKDADVLRTYGTEISRALSNDELAPTYLRGLALYTYNTLMAGEPLPYRFAHLTAGNAAVPDTPPPEISHADKP